MPRTETATRRNHIVQIGQVVQIGRVVRTGRVVVRASQIRRLTGVLLPHRREQLIAGGQRRRRL
jgi:hypothetical protein